VGGGRSSTKKRGKGRLFSFSPWKKATLYIGGRGKKSLCSVRGPEKRKRERICLDVASEKAADCGCRLTVKEEKKDETAWARLREKRPSFPFGALQPRRRTLYTGKGEDFFLRAKGAFSTREKKRRSHLLPTGARRGGRTVPILLPRRGN